MMKIAQTDRKQEERAKIKNKKGASSTGKKESLFAYELQSRIDIQYDGSIEELISDLKDQEKKFLETQSLYELRKYKSIVQKVLKCAMNESLEIKNLKRSRSNMADHTIVLKISNKLQEISDAVMKSNKAFDLFRAIEDVRGLLLDLSY